MKDCKAVIFDMDGVIFDSEKLVLLCWEKVAERHHVEKITEVMTACIGTTKALSKEASALFHETVDRDGLPVKRGVRELLDYLQGQEVPLAVASSTRLEVVSQELKQAGLYEYFQVVMGGDQLRRSKPEPDIYLMTCDKLGIQPAQAYAIEDSYNGIRSAYSAGMKPIMVPDILSPTEEMREKSVAVLDDLLQVRKWFEE